jgi:hypothetical protein
METEKALLQEQKLDKIATYAPYAHCAGFAILVTLGYLKPRHYSEIIQGFAMMFLFVTFVINRIYIYAGKELEKHKEFSEKEFRMRKREYFIKFFTPIFFWTGCVVLC